MKRLLVMLCVIACLFALVVPAMATEETVRVYAQVPADWTNPGFWAWSGSTNAFDGWPGEKMTQDGDWYYIDIPAWVDGVIVNADGGLQTADLTIEAGKDVWLVVTDKDNVAISYEAPAPGETDPEETEPEVTDPEVTEPEVTEPEVTEPENTEAPADGETEPETTEPQPTTPAPVEDDGPSKQTVILVMVGILAAIIIAAVLLSWPKKK